MYTGQRLSAQSISVLLHFLAAYPPKSISSKRTGSGRDLHVLCDACNAFEQLFVSVFYLLSMGYTLSLAEVTAFAMCSGINKPVLDVEGMHVIRRG